ncbi:MAG: pantoate--beta-alanine ligase [Bacteroidales bacterium]|nr:pantoate--beta-alanine ligase [Bacteroidales bacterium]
MKVIQSVSTLQTLLQSTTSTLGFVPTMGALHEGHRSLVARSVTENVRTVVSIFVNPTQFNDANDLEKYPRTLTADCQLLESVSSDIIVFAPTIQEIYPEPDTRQFSYPPTDVVMEGSRRPGHFNGVCQVVSRLFDIVQPDVAYFGEKDFQQIAVIRAMVADLGYKINIEACPIVREPNGLALSSRNTRLTSSERQKAAYIHQTLAHSLTLFQQGKTISQVIAHVVNTLNAYEDYEVEYYEIVDGHTLATVTHWEASDYIVGCITVYAGQDRVRLIDNITYRKP